MLSGTVGGCIRSSSLNERHKVYCEVFIHFTRLLISAFKNIHPEEEELEYYERPLKHGVQYMSENIFI